MTPPAVVADFKAQFTREFVYGVTKDKVMDADITRGLNEAMSVFNSGLWADDDERKTVFLYASAHFMVLNLQAAGGLFIQGLGLGVQSRGTGVIQSKSVGQVTIAYVLPESLTGDAILSGFMRTDFGLRYLQVLVPRLVGQCYTVEGFNENALLGGATMPDQDLLPTGNFVISADADILAYGSAIPHYIFYVAGITETSARIVLARSGNIKALRVKAGANTLSGSVTIKLMKNGVAQNLSLTLLAGELAGQDSVTSISVSAGDTISIKVDITGLTSGELTDITATVVFQ